MTTTYEDIHRDVIEQCIKGDPSAQFKLYSLYAKAMYNICLRMVRQQEEAEDLLQEAFTYAFSRLNTFRFEAAFGAWLKRITVNTCINHLKKKRAELVLTEKNIERIEEEEVDYEELTFRVEEVKQAIERLPDGYRVVLSLYLLEGYDHKEIAEILNISESTSKSQYLRAKQKIKEELSSHERPI